jgi:hypothetical protein
MFTDYGNALMCLVFLNIYFLILLYNLIVHLYVKGMFSHSKKRSFKITKWKTVINSFCLWDKSSSRNKIQNECRWSIDYIKIINIRQNYNQQLLVRHKSIQSFQSPVRQISLQSHQCLVRHKSIQNFQSPVR